MDLDWYLLESTGALGHNLNARAVVERSYVSEDLHMYRFTDDRIAPAYRVLDSGVAVMSLVLVLVLMNLPQQTGQLGAFFETRITLKNVLLMSALALAWPSVFAAFGLYRFRELGRFPIELSRIVKGCTLGSAFVIPVALTSSSGSFDWARCSCSY